MELALIKGKIVKVITTMTVMMWRGAVKDDELSKTLRYDIVLQILNNKYPKCAFQ